MPMKEVEKWIKKSGEDLNDAKFNLEGKRFETAAFLAHQAAEKALKALYILKFKRLWKTHDLVGLLTKLKGDENLLKACDELNRHYIDTRYPTEAEYNEEIVKNALKKAEEVVKWVKKRIEK